MPFQPPTRPHSARPQPALNASLFGSSSSAPSSSRPGTSQSASSVKGHRGASREAWDDAWDSSSDKEDGVHETQLGRPSTIGTASSPKQSLPIPITKQRSRVSLEEGGETGPSGVTGTSYTVGSFQHITIPVDASPRAPQRPHLFTSKTYADPATAPPPGTAVVMETNAGEDITRSKLPPGGSWEIVDESDLREPDVTEVVKAGKEAVRADVDDILNDPLRLLQNLSVSVPSTPVARTSSPSPALYPVDSSTPTRTSAPVVSFDTPDTGARTPSKKEGLSRQRSVRTERRREKFSKVLKGRADDGGGVDLAELRRLAWSGVPSEVRPIAWQLLLNYLPLPTQPRLTTLNRKRREYSQLVDQYFGRGLASLDQQIWHQIEIDVPRTRPGVPLWSCITAQRALERILYVWAIRHPASGYVQGINDLVCPFFQVFLGAYIDTDPELFDVAYLPPTALAAIEADSFWCLSKLLDGIQDNYISQQPGIQRLVKRMSELIKRIDAPLAAHFEDQGVEFMQFAFRWMNCLLMREISVKCTIRMWDTYLAEGTDAFSQFHLYVCSALLVKYSERLREMDFQEMIIFLQCLPTHHWNDHDIELLLSEAYVLKTVWQGAENHFANQPIAQNGPFSMLGR